MDSGTIQGQYHRDQTKPGHRVVHLLELPIKKDYEDFLNIFLPYSAEQTLLNQALVIQVKGLRGHKKSVHQQLQQWEERQKPSNIPCNVFYLLYHDTTTDRARPSHIYVAYRIGQNQNIKQTVDPKNCFTNIFIPKANK